MMLTYAKREPAAYFTLLTLSNLNRIYKNLCEDHEVFGSYEGPHTEFLHGAPLCRDW
jgi:hypothetical protein